MGGSPLYGQTGNMKAEPVFGKSNLIFTLAQADGLIRIPRDANGLSAGNLVEVYCSDERVLMNVF